MGFGDQRSKTATAKMSAHLWNKTKSAGPIAAFGDFDEGVMRGRRQNTRRRFVVEISRALIAERNDWKRARVGFRIANGEDVIYLAGADESIHLGQRRFQVVAITFDQTAGHDQSRRFAVGLQARRFENGIDRFLLGRVDETAGVDDEGVGLVGVSG